MKSKLLAILFFMSFPLLVWSQANIIMDAAMEKELNLSVENTIKEALYEDDEELDEGERLEPTLAGLREPFFEMVYELYLGGYVSFPDFEKFKTDYNQLQDIQIPQSGPAKAIQQQKFTAMLKTFFASQFAKFKATPQKCTNYLGIVNHGQCCSGLVVGPHTNFKFPNGNLKKDHETCSSHSQCFSGVCIGIEEGESTGTCEAVRTCFQEIPTGQLCGENNPICKDRANGVKCLAVNYDSSNTNSCKKASQSCSKNTECCSDSCQSGKCVDQMLCQKCVGNGIKPESNERCCSGLYKGLEGKCIQDWPPFILPQSNVIKTKFFDRVSFILNELFGISNVHAREIERMTGVDEVTPREVGNGQTGIDPKKKNSSQDNKSKCKSPCNHISHLPKDERQAVEKIQESCVDAAQNTTETQKCLKEAIEKEQSYYAQHKEKKTIWQSDASVAQSEYVSEYGIPHVTARGLSDAKECRFNSLKDDWNDASNLEKNAEVTLRAFEYIYSGKGSDWWKEDNKNTIFQRLQELSKKLRLNRHAYIESLKQNDTKMTCLCIAAFGGVNKFPDRGQFFKDTCEADPKLQDQIKDLSILDNGNSGTDSNDAYANHLDNISQGATGIKHEQFLVNWLDARKSIQFERFDANTKVEEELQAIVNYLRTEPWTQKNEKKEKVLYQYAIRWMSGFWAWAAVLTGIGAIATLITAIAGGGGLWGNSGVSGLAIIGVTTALFQDPSLAPDIKDVEIKSKECWSFMCFNKYDGFRRELYYRRSEHCKINAPSHLCLKNAYISPASDKKKKSMFYLIDIQAPLFVDTSKFKHETNFTATVDQAFNKGVARLAKTHPNKHKGSGKRWRGYWAKRSSKYQERNVFFDYYANEAGDVKYNHKKNGYRQIITYFSPDNYKLVNFDNSFKQSFIDGVKKYATCYGLKACGGQSTGIDQNTNGLTEKDIGFKLFFENPETGTHNEEEVNAFAEYVYQLHFLWPNTSEENSLSYPLPGMVPYFEAVLYNVKLLGSLRADRGNRYNDAYTAYEKDLAKRMKDYNMPAGSMGLGEKSRNAKFGKKFMTAFQKIDLKGGVGIASLQTELDAALKANEYNAAEASALKAAMGKAMRAAEDKKRAAHYEATQGQTERGKNNIENAKKFLNSFNSPINRFPTNVAGSRFAGAQNDTLAGTLTDSPKENQTASVATGGGANASMTSPWDNTSSSWNNSSSGSGSGGSGYSDATVSSKKGDQLNSDISNTDVEHMLLSLNKDKSLFEENPDDTLFIKVSKAYRRNLERVLVRKVDLAQNTQVENKVKKSVHSDISDEEKSKLKELLNKN